MRSIKLRHSMQIEKEVLEKFKHVAQHQGRSINRDLICYMKTKIKTFEDEHGEIVNNEAEKN